MLLPRTIDKLRAYLPGGNPGEYFINGKIKGISGYLLERLGVEEGALLEVVGRVADDAEVARWLSDHADSAQYPALNETLRRIRPKHAEDPAYFAQIYAETLTQHPELERIIDIIDADDRRMFVVYSASRVGEDGAATCAIRGSRRRCR
jgi:hypothetical protein